jgi:hypothetical protein
MTDATEAVTVDRLAQVALLQRPPQVGDQDFAAFAVDAACAQHHGEAVGIDRPSHYSLSST